MDHIADTDAKRSAVLVFLTQAMGRFSGLQPTTGHKRANMEDTMKHLFVPMMAGVSLLVTSAGLALATDVHNVTGTKGQPNQTIGSAQTGTVTPGNTTSSTKSKGSPFGSTAFSATKYAGTQPQNSKNPKSVSQYDVAGFQQSHNH